jgi:uncharacterized cupredoxin-like copper-binding protein
MKRFHLAILVACLVCLWLCACSRSISSSATKTATPTGPQKINITIGDFYIHSPVTTFLTGRPYLLVVTNKGVHHHDLFIMHPMETMTMTMADVYSYAMTNIYNIAPNQTKTLSVTFHHTAPPGMLEFSCHYGGHYETGMHQAIVVKAAPGASVSPYPNNGIPPFPHSQSRPGPVVSFDVSYTNPVNDRSFFIPTQVTIKTGQSIRLSNLADQDLTCISTPDTGLGNLEVAKNQYVDFNPPNSGTFVISCVQFPNKKFTVVVQ